MNGEEIVKKFEESKTYRKNFENLYKSAYEHFMPQRSKSFGQSGDATNGEANDGQDTVYDSTPLDALNKFVSKLQSSLVPAQQQWLKLRVGTAITEGVEEKQRVLDQINDIFFAAIHNSNFDVEVTECFYDLAVGTACLMMIDSGSFNSPFKFKTVPLSELYLENVGNSQFGGIFRCHSVIPMMANQVWADIKQNKDMAEEGKPQEFIEYVAKEKNGGYTYYVVYNKTKDIVVQRSLEYNPFIVFRWSVMPGEVYGRGPVLFALPDAKSLNKTKELILKNASLAVSGAYTYEDDGVTNPENVSIEPGAFIPVASNGGQSRAPSIAPLRSSADFNVGDIVLKDLRQSIYQIMFANPMGPVDAPVKSATEIEYRQKEFADTIGAPFGRLQTELIKNIISTGLTILNSINKIDIGEFKVNGEEIAVRYSSPLAITQESEKVMKIRTFLSTVAEMFGPQVAMAVIKPTMIPKLAAGMGIDMNDVSTSDELEEMRNNAADAEAEQMEQENQLRMLNAQAQAK